MNRNPSDIEPFAGNNEQAVVSSQKASTESFTVHNHLIRLLVSSSISRVQQENKGLASLKLKGGQPLHLSATEAYMYCSRSDVVTDKICSLNTLNMAATPPECFSQ